MFPLVLLGLGFFLLASKHPPPATPGSLVPSAGPLPLPIPLQTPGVMTLTAHDGESTAVPVKRGDLVLIQPPGGTVINFACSPATGNVLTPSPEDPIGLGAVRMGTVAYVASQAGSTRLEWSWQDVESGVFHAGATTITVG